MKRICHITSATQDHIPRIIKESKCSLKYGYTPFIVAQGNTFSSEGIQFIGIPVNNKGRIYGFTKMTRILYLKSLEVDADIYQLHDPLILRYALRLKKKGKKVIFDSHEFYREQIKEKYYIPKILRNLTSFLYGIYETYICRRIDAVIQVCTLEGRNYFKGRAKKTIFLTNVPIIKEFNQKIKIPFKERKNITYIGSIAYERGITQIIKATYKAGSRLILAGNFINEDYKKEMIRLHEYSVVDYLGFLNNNEIKEVLNECLAGASTLLNIGQYYKIDTLPTKVYEYMLMALPVILSDTPFARKIVNEYKIGICVNPENIEEIAQAITYFMQNPSIAEQMGQNGREAVYNFLNWEREMDKLIQLYISLED